MSDNIVNVDLGDNVSMYVETIKAGGLEKVAETKYNFTTLFDTISVFSKKFTGFLETTGFQKADIEYGFGVKIEAGELFAVLVKASSEMNIKIKLTWEK